MVVRTGYKDHLSETNVRVLGCVSTYKKIFEIEAQLLSQVMTMCDSDFPGHRKLAHKQRACVSLISLCRFLTDS